MPTEDLRGLSNDDLEALIGGDDESQADEAPEQADQSQGEVSEPLAQQDPPAEPAAPEEPQQPAPRMVPLAEVQRERQKRQQYEALLNDPNALAQHLAQAGYKLTPAQQQEQAAFLDDELAQWTQQQIQGTEQRLQSVEIRVRNQVSESLAAATVPDFKEVIDGLAALQAEDQTLAPLIAQAVSNYLTSPDPNLNPALATYELGKRLLNKQATDPEAEIERRVNERLAEALAKQQPGLPTVNGVARAGSVTPGAEKPKPLYKMTDEELDRLLED